MQPLRDLLQIRPIEAPNKTPGGIFLPDRALKRSYKGTVIAAGPGFPTDDGVRPMQTKVGDVVLYTEFSECESVFRDDDGHEYLMLRESEVLGVVIGEPEPLLGKRTTTGHYKAGTIGDMEPTEQPA